jgi:Flp pilus assembly pilin Flp
MRLTSTGRRAASPPRGQDLAEYALILLLVAIAVIDALLILGPVTGNILNTVNNSLPGV